MDLLLVRKLKLLMNEVISTKRRAYHRISIFFTANRNVFVQLICQKMQHWLAMLIQKVTVYERIYLICCRIRKIPVYAYCFYEDANQLTQILAYPSGPNISQNCHFHIIILRETSPTIKIRKINNVFRTLQTLHEAYFLLHSFNDRFSKFARTENTYL